MLALDEYGLALHSLDELVSFRMLPYSEFALLTLELPPQITELSRELSQTTQKLEAMQRLYEAESAVARQSAEHSRRDSEQMSRLEGRLAVKGLRRRPLILGGSPGVRIHPVVLCGMCTHGENLHAFIHSFIHSLDFKVVGANHDHWTSRLKVSDKDTQMF